MASMWWHSLFGRKFKNANRGRRKTAPLTLEALESRVVPSTVRWVDNNPADIAANQFTSSGGSQPALVTGLTPGVNLFSTISAAVAAASAGDTINVSNGVGPYNEQVAVNETLTINGNQFGVDARTRSTAAESVVDGTTNNGDTPFYVTANNVVINGFTIQGATNQNDFGFGVVLQAGTSGAHVVNDIIQNNIAGLSLSNAVGGNQAVIQFDLFNTNNVAGPGSGTGIYTDEFNAGGDLDNVLIDSNTFLTNNNEAVVIGATTDNSFPGTTPKDTDLTISNNDMDGNGGGIFISSSANSAITGNNIVNSTSGGDGIFLGGGDDGLTIANNNISGNAGFAINVGPDVSGAGFFAAPNANVTASENSFANNTAGAISVTPGRFTGTLNASGNWWNTAIGATPNDAAAPNAIEALTSGAVHVGSFLDSGTNLSAGNGFTPAGTTEMWVPETGATSGLTNVSGVIQDGVNSAVPGMTVRVAADTYAENVTVTQSLTLLGANAGIDPNPPGSRVAETVVEPAVTDVTGTDGTIFRVGTNAGHVDVTIDGFTINGDNPGLTGGLSANGAQIDTGAGIINSVSSFDTNPGGYDARMIVEYNIIENLERYGVLIDSTPAATAEAGNIVSYNKIANIPFGNNFTAGNGRGRGVAFEDNIYGTVSYNVMTQVNVGWQDDNDYLASPGAGTLVDHNTISTYHRGIFHNLQYDNATAATISNNQISVETVGDFPASGTDFGIELISIESGVGVTVTNNSDTGNAYGIILTGDTTTAGITVSGGTLSGNVYGVYVTDNDPQFPSDGNTPNAVISGVTITGATTAGVFVQAVNGEIVGATLTGGTSITGGAAAIDGTGFGTLSLTGVTSSGNTSGGSITGTDGTVDLSAAGGVSVSADASAMTFGDAQLQTISYSGSTLSNLNLDTNGNDNAFSVKPVTGGTTSITVDGGTPFPAGNTSTLSLDLSAVSSPVVNSTGPGAGNLTATPSATPLSWTHISTVSASPAAPAVITLTPGDNYHVFRSGTSNVNLEVDDVTSATTVFDAEYASVSTLTLNGTGVGGNTVNVDFAGATDPIPSGGITYNGVAGTNVLEASNGSFTTLTSTYTGAQAGSLAFDSLGMVSYTGLATVDTSASTVSGLVFDVANNSAQGSLEDDGTLSNGISQFRSLNSTLALTKFSNPTTSLTINGFSTTTITVNAAAQPLDFTAALIITGGPTLSGGGTLAGAVTITGVISPGASFGSTGTAVLSTGPVTFNSGSAFDVDLNGTTAGSGYDQISSTGALSIAATGTIPVLNVSIASGFTPALNSSYTIIHDSSVTGTFAGLTEGTYFLVDDLAFQITYQGNGGHDVVITRTKAPVTPVITASNKSYDGTTTAFLTSQTLTGVFPADVGNVSLVVSAANFSDANAGMNKTVTATGLSLTGSAAGNYVLVSTTATTMANITPATITVTAVSDTKFYDATTASAGGPNFQVTSFNSNLGESEQPANTLYNSDSFTSLTQHFDSINAGSRTLIASYVIGPNYTVSNSVTAAGSITPATVTIAAVSDSKVYDGNTSSTKTPTFQVTSFNSALGETELPANTLYNSDQFTTLMQTFDSRNAGARTLSVTYAIGANYNVVSTTTAAGSISQAPLTVTVTSDLMLMGNNTPPLAGVVNGMHFTGNLTYTTVQGDSITITLSTPANSSSPVGQYAITAMVSGAASGNYMITSAPGTMYVVTIGHETSTNPNTVFYSRGGDASNPYAWVTAQLTNMKQNVSAGYMKTTDVVYAAPLLSYIGGPFSTAGLDGGGFLTIASLEALANQAIVMYANPANRTTAFLAYMNAIAQSMQSANNNTTFVQQPTPPGV